MDFDFTDILDQFAPQGDDSQSYLPNNATGWIQELSKVPATLNAGGNQYDSLISNIYNELAGKNTGQSGQGGQGGSTQTKADNGWADLASVLGGYSSGEKANRIVEGGFTQPYDQMMINREKDYNTQMLQAQQDRDRTENNALWGLAKTNYVKNNEGYKPPTIQLNGKSVTLPDMGFGAKASSPEQIAGATSLESQLVDRLKPGGTYTPTQNYQVHDLDSYAKPGVGEKIGSYGALAAGGLGTLNTLLGGNNTPIMSDENGIGGNLGGRNSLGSSALGALTQKGGSYLSKLLGGSSGAGTGWTSGNTVFGSGLSGTGTLSNILGKAVPIAGAITGGIGLTKDQGVARNLMNGVSTGASIGSIVPGIGTAVGAGIGALVGGLRSIGGGPSETELQGRATQDQGINTLITQATPEQQAEAQKSGWDKPQDALAMIVVRDKMAQAGVQNPDLMAQQWLQSVWKAEQNGGQAVSQAFDPVSQYFNA